MLVYILSALAVIGWLAVAVMYSRITYLTSAVQAFTTIEARNDKIRDAALWDAYSEGRRDAMDARRRGLFVCENCGSEHLSEADEQRCCTTPDADDGLPF